MTKDEANTVASAAAQDILDAIEALPEYLSDALSWRLFNDESIALSFIGESLRPAAAGPDRAPYLGQHLLGETFLGDVELLAATLSADQEPWCTIRASFERIALAWRASHPGIRTKAELDAMRSDR